MQERLAARRDVRLEVSAAGALIVVRDRASLGEGQSEFAATLEPLESGARLTLRPVERRAGEPWVRALWYLAAGATALLMLSLGVEMLLWAAGLLALGLREHLILLERRRLPEDFAAVVERVSAELAPMLPSPGPYRAPAEDEDA